MESGKIRGRAITLLVLMVLALIAWLPIEGRSSQPTFLQVRFLDVGQGDSIHIVTPDGYEALIDGGPSSMVLREFSQTRSFFDRTIDLVIASHFDADHVAGLVDILERYEVSTIVYAESEKDSVPARAFLNSVEAEGAQVEIAQAGQIIKLGEHTVLRIFSPYGDTSDWESNTASVIVQVVYGEVEFLLTGDAPANIENYLVEKYGGQLESEVLKLGHHGSKTSSTDIFLSTVQPQYAVVSSGKDNRYGHPHETVVERVRLLGVNLLNTADYGTLVFESDGERVWRK
jgi:competence protein ComEC